MGQPTICAKCGEEIPFSWVRFIDPATQKQYHFVCTTVEMTRAAQEYVERNRR